MEKHYRKLLEDIKKISLSIKVLYTKLYELEINGLKESDEYGPHIEDLLGVLIDNGWNANIICETPLRDIDALKMKELYESMI